MADSGELQKVFELCSPDIDGYILTDFLADKLAEQLDHRDLNTIKSVLDPKRFGKISFDQFKVAITEIRECSDQVSNLQNPETDFQNGLDNDADSTSFADNEEDFRHTSPVSKGLFQGKTSTPFCKDDDSSSDPENTYNEYDVPDGDDMAHSVNGDDIMESFEAIGESPVGSRGRRSTEHLIIPLETSFRRHGSMRRSHRRAHSFTHRGPSPGLVVAEDQSMLDETASVTSDLEDLSEKVDLLQDHVAKLTEEKRLQAQYEAANSEKQQLALKNHDLEERLVNLEQRLIGQKRDYEMRLDDLRSKLTREHQLELQVLQEKCQNADKENVRLSLELSEVKLSHGNAKEDCMLLQTKVEGLTNQVMQTNEEYRRLNNQSNTQRERYDEEKALLKEEIDKLRIELEEAADDRNALAERLSTLDLTQSPSAAMLSAKLSNLEMENERLKNANEDLNVQLARNIVDARTLMGNAPSESIADELAHATRDEVVEALQKKENENSQLRQYLDKIILSVLEKDPSILEIK